MADEIDKLDEDELVAQVGEWYSAAIEGNQDWRDRGTLCRDFRAGQQWSDEDKDTLNRAGKPALTINRIQPTIGFIAGNQRQNRKDIRVRPVRNASESAATVLTELAMHTMDVSNASFAQADMFEAGCVTGKGWLFAEVITDDLDLGGSMVNVSMIPSFRVHEDPACDSFDLEQSAKFIIREYYEDMTKLKAMYPDKSELIGTDQLPSGSGLLGKMWDKLTNKGRQHEIDSIDGDDARANVRNKYRLCVRECWWKDYRTVGISTDIQGGSVVLLLGEEERANGKKLAETQGVDELGNPTPAKYSYREQVKGVLCKTVVCGNTLLSHEVDPLKGIHTFPMFRFAAYFDDGFAWGVVDNLIGPQEEENKRRSQALHHLNQSANSGWIVQSIQAAYRKILETFGSKPGMIIEQDKCGGRVERINPAPLSEGHIQLAIAASNDIKEISGVANMLGQDSQSKESGLALGLRQRQGMTILEEIYDRFDYTCQLFGTFLVELIRRDMGGNPIYTDAEIAKIVDLEKACGDDIMAEVMPMAMQQAAQEVPQPESGNSPDMMQMYQQAVQIKAQQIAMPAAVKLLLHQVRDIATGRYAVQVSQSPNAPTAKIAAFMELVEVGKMYPGSIPPEVFINATDIKDKDEIIRGIEQQKQAAQQQAAQQAQPRVA